MTSRLRARSALVAGVLLACMSAGASTAQTVVRATSVTPSSWLQLRSGVDNNAAVAGSLRAEWQYHAPHAVRGLSVADGVVVMGTESADAEGDAKAPDQTGVLTGLDAASGRQLWTESVPSWVHGDPIIDHGTAYVTYGRWPMTSPGGIAAFAVGTGVRLWFKRTPTGNMPAPAFDTISRSLLMAGGDGMLYRLSPADGSVLSSSGLRSANAMSSPRILPNGTAIMGAGSVVTCYDIARDSFTWRFHPPLFHSIGDVPVAVTDSFVFTTGTKNFGFRNAMRALPVREFVALTTDAVRSKKLGGYKTWYQQQWLIALDRTTGRMRWRRPLGIGLQVPRNTAGTPVAVDDRVVVSSPVSKTISAFALRTGTLLWSRKQPSSHKGAVTVIGRDVVFGDKAGILHVLRLVDGVELGACNAGAGFSPLAPVLVGQTFIIPTRDGWVHAVPYDLLRRRALARPSGSCYGTTTTGTPIAAR
jgi:outer membrane protein assembly factor BamB